MVTSIGDFAFYDCSSLTSIEIPNSVTSIGRMPFFGCSSLTAFYGKFASEDNKCLIKDNIVIASAPADFVSFKIPNTVTSVAEYAFYGCKSLTSVEIPNSVTSIGNYAFNGCSSLTTVDLGDSVTSIGDYAFNGCKSLSSVEIPNSVTSIGSNAFSYCSSLTSVEIPNSVTSIGSNAFSYCSSLTSVEIPNSVTYIGNYAFNSCSSLTTVDFGDSITSIDIYAFYGCTSLNNIRCLANEIPSCSRYAFPTTIYGTCTLSVPESALTNYQTTEPWSNFKNIEGFYVAPTDFELLDGDAYTNEHDIDDIDVNYIRNFEHQEWQPLYIPFNMSYEEWCDKAEIARINAVHQFDRNGDGDYDDEDVDEIIIEFVLVNNGELRPNTPYVIRPKQTGEVTFECTGKTLLAAPAQGGSVWCASTQRKYTLTGVYEPKTDMDGFYAMSGGAFRLGTASSPALAPYRFYLTIENVDNGYGTPDVAASAPSMMKIIVNGSEDTPTGIDEMASAPTDNVYYDLMGRRVENPARGIYIFNGKKVLVK